MANGYSDISTAQRNPGRLVVVPGQRLFSPVKNARFEITLRGDEAANDWHELCQRLPESSYQVIPEQCRIRHISGNYSFTSKLQRVNAAGTASDLTGTLVHTQATAPGSLAFAAAANTEPPVLSDTDALRIFFTVSTSPGVGAKFVVELAFRTVEA